MTEPRQRRSPDRSAGRGTGLAALGVAALAIGCCAATPLLVIAVGSLTVGVLAGIGAGALALVVLGAAAMLARRRRVPKRMP
ncbi:MAG: hypothetical protein AB7V58_14050 [Solirubrobacterales bacterium]